MAQIKGLDPVIVPRIPYVPIEPWEWFKENGLEDKMGGPPPMGAGPVMTPTVYIKDGKRTEGNDATLYGGEIKLASVVGSGTTMTVYLPLAGK